MFNIFIFLSNNRLPSFDGENIRHFQVKVKGFLDKSLYHLQIFPIRVFYDIAFPHTYSFPYKLTFFIPVSSIQPVFTFFIEGLMAEKNGNYLKWINQHLVYLAGWVIDHRILTLFACILLAILSIFFSSNLHIDNSIEAYFNADDPSYAVYDNFMDECIV